MYRNNSVFYLFIGAMGKSAQIGLHTWLADAMEGPTPVSALIHAATMVTAGVFLVSRCSPLFEYAPVALKFCYSCWSFNFNICSLYCYISKRYKEDYCLLNLQSIGLYVFCLWSFCIFCWHVPFSYTCLF